MRVWILNHYASPPDQPAGTRHYDLGRALVDRGHDVTIFASSFSHFTLREERLKRNQLMRIECVDGVRFVWIRTTPYAQNDARRVINMLSYAIRTIWVQRQMDRPDVVVGSSVHPAAAAAAFLIGSARKIPFVFEVRDLWPQTLIDMGALRDNSAITRILRALECFLYRRARTVITVLPKAAGYITPLGIPAEKVVYVPNGIADSNEATEDLDANSARLKARIAQWRKDGYLIAGYAGSLVRAQKVDALVDAARILRDRGISNIAFVFVGEGPEKEKCRQIAQHHALHNVLFWDPLPKRDIQTILGTFDVALFSLRDIAVFKYGVSSNKLFDYLASGRPILSACAIEDTPVSASGGGICVPPEAPEQIAEALVRLASMSAADRHAMGERGRQWVYRHHGTTALAERFLDALVQAQR